MCKLFCRSPFALFVLLMSSIGSTQQPANKRLPIDVNPNFMNDIARPQFSAKNQMSLTAKAAMSQNRVVTVPTFSSSFKFQGQTFPFTMVGRAPQRGDTTRVETQLIAVSMFFEGFLDANGNNIVLDVGTAVPR